jgi:hypothetical protein
MMNTHKNRKSAILWYNINKENNKNMYYQRSN